MGYRIEPTDQDINDVLDACIDQDMEGGSRWPNMTYEQGVAEAIRWIIGISEEHPMQE